MFFEIISFYNKCSKLEFIENNISLKEFLKKNKLSDYFGVEVADWNLGLGGGSFDFISRTLVCGVNALKPDLVIITPSTSLVIRLPGTLQIATV